MTGQRVSLRPSPRFRSGLLVILPLALFLATAAAATAQMTPAATRRAVPLPEYLREYGSYRELEEDLDASRGQPGGVLDRYIEGPGGFVRADWLEAEVAKILATQSPEAGVDQMGRRVLGVVPRRSGGPSWS